MERERKEISYRIVLLLSQGSLLWKAVQNASETGDTSVSAYATYLRISTEVLRILLWL